MNANEVSSVCVAIAEAQATTAEAGSLPSLGGHTRGRYLLAACITQVSRGQPVPGPSCFTIGYSFQGPECPVAGGGQRGWLVSIQPPGPPLSGSTAVF